MTDINVENLVINGIKNIDGDSAKAILIKMAEEIPLVREQLSNILTEVSVIPKIIYKGESFGFRGRKKLAILLNKEE